MNEAAGEKRALEAILEGYRITEGADEEGKPRGTDRGNRGIGRF